MYIILFLLATLIALALLVIVYKVVSHRVQLRPLGVLLFCSMIVSMLFLADTADKMRQQERFEKIKEDIEQHG